MFSIFHFLFLSVVLLENQDVRIQYTYMYCSLKYNVHGAMHNTRHVHARLELCEEHLDCAWHAWCWIGTHHHVP